MSSLQQEKQRIPVSVLREKFCEEQAFPYLFSKSKFRCNAPQDIPISPV